MDSLQRIVEGCLVSKLHIVLAYFFKREPMNPSTTRVDVNDNMHVVFVDSVGGDAGQKRDLISMI